MANILHEYELCSGQKINFAMSLLYFNSNVGLKVREELKRVLGVRSTFDPEKYLGLPVIVGRNKKSFTVY